MEYIDLVMMNGELVRIECKTEYFDEIMDAIDNARKRNDWWSTGMFEGTRAEYMGLLIDRIDAGKIVGML